MNDRRTRLRLTIGLGGLVASASTAAGGPIDFDRDVRPIIADKCFTCHGPDAAARKAGLRLDTPEGAMALDDDGHAAVVPGRVDASLLWSRISTDDADERMPPASTNKQLDAREREILRRWIEEGAAWSVHWAFVAPAQRAAPSTDASWARNAIDGYILARLTEAGLTPTPEADRTSLIRRATLDLTGLPPTPEAVDAFVADRAPGAYERLLDGLLASPRYGEHQGRYWLDAARYGDTHGLHLDNERSMWRWRDWVIEAFNENKPFDTFTIEQLAGDLLPEPTLDQRIATGFNRNNVTTSEGGAIDAEYLVEYAVDRVETTSTVWLGLTAGCARCHDHKYDPISQREFYQLFAFFNNVAENAMDGNQRDPPPSVRAPTAEDATRLAELETLVVTASARLDEPLPVLDAAEAAWARELATRGADRWTVLAPEGADSIGGATLTIQEDGSVLASGENPDRDAFEITAQTTVTGITTLRLEALTHPDLPHSGPGRAPNANFVLAEIEVDIAPADAPAGGQRSWRTIPLVAAQADLAQTNGFYPPFTIDGVRDDRGWAVAGYERREDRAAYFTPAEPFGYAGGTIVRVRMDFSTMYAQHAIGRPRLAISTDDDVRSGLAPLRTEPWHVAGPFPAKTGNDAYELVLGPETSPGAIDLDAQWDGIAWTERTDFVDARTHLLEGERCATYLARRVDAPTDRTARFSLGSDDAVKLWVNGRLVHSENTRRPVAADQAYVEVGLRAGPNDILLKIVNEGGGYGFYFRVAEERGTADAEHIVSLLARPDDERTENDRTTLRRHYRKRHWPEYAVREADLVRARDERDAFRGRLPITLVMRERADRRMAYVLDRGQYDQPRDAVQPDVPAVLPALARRPANEGGAEAIADRLDLARWLVDPAHPLTARVFVNRVWQQHFGTGLVKTAGDFGTQGERPTHPALLDWLALAFIDSGWDIKALHRLIMTSATYRQTARIDETNRRLDPENRLLAHGSRFRMDAEMIRDQALAASGLLVERLGGASVRPYQPEGVWNAVAYPDSNTRTFRADTGDALHRRSLYTFWKRTAPPPNLALFDAPTRETCTVRRPRTNTPLQMLVLLNDPQFVEAARALAERAVREAGPDPAARVRRVFRLVVSRAPTEAELDALVGLYVSEQSRYADRADQADALLATGPVSEDVPCASDEMAALTVVASVVLSLDEALTKG